VRTALLTALVASADESRRLWARRFLTGLSADEMEFIANFLGASILDPATAPRHPSRAELARSIERFTLSDSPHTPSPDEEHKMILLLEYLSRCAMVAESVTAARA
jgi:hypothetical protein